MLAAKIGLTKNFKENFNNYFHFSNNEKKRIESWTNIMNYLQFYIHNPQSCKLRLLKTKDKYPLVIIKRGNDKLMIPIIQNRAVSLKLSDFKKIDVEPSVLELFSDIESLKFKVFNDEYYNSKPRVFKSRNI